MTNELRDQVKTSKYFYRDYFRVLCNVLGGFLIIVLVLSLAIIYFYVQRPFPDFYASSTNGALVQITPKAPPST